MGKEEVEFEFSVSFESVSGFAGLPKGVEQVAVTWARGSSAKGTTPPTTAVDGRAEWSPIAKATFTSHLFKDSSKPVFEEKSFDIGLVAYQNKKEGKKVATLTLNLADYVEANDTRIEERSADGAFFRFIVSAVVKKGKWQPSGQASSIKGAIAVGNQADTPTAVKSETSGAAATAAAIEPKLSASKGGGASVAPAKAAPAAQPQFHPPPNFRRGELTQFVVAVDVIEARNLAGKDSSGMSDPMVEVKVKTKTQTKKLSTTTKTETVSCVWDETLQFELKLAEDEYRNASIEVTVFDADIVKNEVIGAFSFGLADTYMKEHREMHNVWVALGDPTFKLKGIQGYLKLNVRVLADADAPHEYNDEDDEAEGEGDDISSMVLMPPDIKQQAKIFTITVGRCEGLPKMDAMGSCDCYVKAKFGVSTARTKTVKDNQNPTFNQTLILPVVLPAVSDILELSIWDEDAAADDLIAFESFSIEEIIKEGGKKIRWINFYCVPMDIDKKMRRLMEPTQFCGRLTCKIDITDVAEGADPPEPTSGFSGPVADPRSVPYFLHVDVWEAQEMCTQEKLQVKVTFDGKIQKTSYLGPKKSGLGSVAWYQGLPEIESTLSTDISSNPNVLVEVFAEGTLSKSRVGYVIIPFSDAANQPEARWLDLTPDISSPLYKKGTLCGMLMLKCMAGEKSGGVPQRSAVSMPKLQEFILRTFLYAARELPSADKSGFNDPYVVVRVGGQECQGKILKQTNNPTWNEEMLMSLMLPENPKLAPPLQFVVMDKDSFGSDLVGRVVLNVNECLVTDVSLISEVPPPQRYRLYVDDVNQKAGELYLSALLVPKVLSPQLKDLKFLPRTRICDVEIFLVGMRNLKPKGTLRPLNKPWLEVDAGDKGDKAKIFKSKSSNSPSKFNPNYFESIKLRVDIPEQFCLVPKLSFTAIDSMMMREYNIGAASVSLLGFLPWMTPQQREQIKAGQFDALAQSSSPSLVTIEPKKYNQDPPHVSVHIANDDNGANDEAKPLLSENESEFEGKGRPSRIKSDKPSEVKEIEMEEQVTDDNDLPATVQDDPILSRPLQKGLMEDWLGSGIFQEAALYRGKVRGVSEKKLKQKQNASGVHNTSREMGVACGNIKFSLRVTDTSAGGKSFGDLPKGSITSQSLVVRVYILRGIQLKSMDVGGSSDPYLVVKHGPGLATTIVDKKSLRKATLNPEFYSAFEFQANIPGDSFCELCVFDQDLVGSDDLIGTTRIDIENRWLNDKWKAMKKKPLEVRPLFAPNSRSSTGRLEFWMDIFTPSEAKITPMMSIQPPVPEPYEVRLIVWRAKDVVAKDGVEQPTAQEVKEGADPTPTSSSCFGCCSCCGGSSGSSDVYITAQFEGMDDKKETDVHWGSSDGSASFNWRMKFDLNLPAKNPRLKLAMWDKDMVGANDSIGECSLNLAAIMRKAYMTKKAASLPERWLPFMHPNYSGIQGYLELSLEVLPKSEADSKPCGQGQEAPNAHPELPKPTGRKAAPWDVAGKAAAMWEAHKWKIFILALLAAVGCGVGVWFYFTYGPGSLLTGGGDSVPKGPPPTQ